METHMSLGINGKRFITDNDRLWDGAAIYVSDPLPSTDDIVRRDINSLLHTHSQRDMPPEKPKPKAKASPAVTRPTAKPEIKTAPVAQTTFKAPGAPVVQPKPKPKAGSMDPRSYPHSPTPSKSTGGAYPNSETRASDAEDLIAKRAARSGSYTKDEWKNMSRKTRAAKGLPDTSFAAGVSGGFKKKK